MTYLLLIILIFCNILDGLLSHHLITLTGKLEEANPLLILIIHKYPQVFLFIKIFAIPLILIIIILNKEYIHSWFTKLILTIVCIIYILTVGGQLCFV